MSKVRKSGKNLQKRITSLFFFLAITFSWKCAVLEVVNQTDTDVSVFSNSTESMDLTEQEHQEELEQIGELYD